MDTSRILGHIYFALLQHGVQPVEMAVSRVWWGRPEAPLSLILTYKGPMLGAPTLRILQGILGPEEVHLTVNCTGPDAVVRVEHLDFSKFEKHPGIKN